MYNILKNVLAVKTVNSKAFMFYTKTKRNYTISLIEEDYVCEWNMLAIRNGDHTLWMFADMWNCHKNGTEPKFSFDMLTRLYLKTCTEDDYETIDTYAAINIDDMKVVIKDKDKRIADLFKLIGYEVEVL